MEPERSALAPWEIPIELTRGVLDRERERARRRAPHAEQSLDAARGVLLGLLFGGLLWLVLAAAAWQLALRGNESLASGAPTAPAPLGDEGPAPDVPSLRALSFAGDPGPADG